MDDSDLAVVRSQIAAIQRILDGLSGSSSVMRIGFEARLSELKKQLDQAEPSAEAERQMANLDRALAAFGSPIEEGPVVTPSPGLFRVLTDEEDAHDG